MTALTQAEASILSQLRDKSMQAHHIGNKMGIRHGVFWHIMDIMILCEKGLIRQVRYIQKWRSDGDMAIYHLTHAGRMALIEYEKCQLTDKV